MYYYFPGKRACLPGIGRGDGWIIPMNIFIETEQFLPQHCTLFENLGMVHWKVFATCIKFF